MARIFLSYDRRDEARAEVMADALGRAGHEVWWDRHIRGGRRFSQEIEAALDAAEVVVVLWSRHSVESDWVRDEAATGRERGRLVPATLDGTPPPLGFRQYQTVALTDAQSVAALDEAVAAVVGGEPNAVLRGPETSRRLGRRALLSGGAALGAAALAGGWWLRSRTRQRASPEVEALLAQAWQAWTQGDTDGNAQAIGLYRRAIDLDPTHADTWGLLCCAYGDRGHGQTGAERQATWLRAKEAGERALGLDDRNAYGRIGLAYARPLRGNWALMERAFRQAEQEQPGKFLVNYSLALLLGDVGRFAEAARLFGTLKGTAPTALHYLWHSQALWASGQPDRADRLIEEASGIFGRHPAIWRQRVDMLLHSGRVGAALAMLKDVQGRPEAVDAETIEMLALAAEAALGRSASAIVGAAERLEAFGRTSVASATAAVESLALLNQTEAAVDLASAIFLSQPFAVPDAPTAAGVAPTVTLDERRTRLLMLPSTAPLRASPRFAELLRASGLEAYWQESRSKPDFRRG